VPVTVTVTAALAV